MLGEKEKKHNSVQVSMPGERPLNPNLWEFSHLIPTSNSHVPSVSLRFMLELCITQVTDPHFPTSSKQYKKSNLFLSGVTVCLSICKTALSMAFPQTIMFLHVTLVMHC